jgi:hypothetical protein
MSDDQIFTIIAVSLGLTIVSGFLQAHYSGPFEFLCKPALGNAEENTKR